jgi:glycosyltransferase involved in cell wall biosynthesis
MHILVAAPQAATILTGGLRTQVSALRRELARLGQQADLFDPWLNYDLKNYDWFYIVGGHVGTVHLAQSVKNLGLKLAVSPVFFSRRRPVLLRLRSLLPGDTACVREVCRLANLVLPNTRAEARLVERGLGVENARMHVIPNGCDERFYQSTPETFVREYGRKDFVLYAGHVGWGRKNLLGLIRAMKTIQRPLVVIGKVLDSEYSRQCQTELAALKDSLLIPGLPQDSDILASAYAACDTFCLPSLFETPGLAALEAGLAGAKIVITRYGGTTEYFAEHARYVDPGSVSSIRRALEQSLAAPRSDALRERIRANYLWQHAAHKLIEALSSMQPRMSDASRSHNPDGRNRR